MRQSMIHNMRLLLLLPLSLMVFLPSCVIHDRKAATLKPAPVTLSQFAGTYRHEASYHTRSRMGEIGSTKLPDVITGRRGWPTGPGMIRVSPSGDITFSFPQYKPDIPTTYINGKDFKFVGHQIIFKRDTAGGRDSPFVGIDSFENRWMLDENGNLVVIHSRNTAGLALALVPAGSSIRSVSIFDRIGRPPAP